MYGGTDFNKTQGGLITRRMTGQITKTVKMLVSNVKAVNIVM